MLRTLIANTLVVLLVSAATLAPVLVLGLLVDIVRRAAF
jgi:hypothetical protein